MKGSAVINKLIIIGAGGHATSVYGVAVACGYEVFSFVDLQPEIGELCGIPVLNDIEPFMTDSNFDFSIAVGANFSRERIYPEMNGRVAIDRFPGLFHPSSTLSPNSSIGYGTVVMANSTVGVGTTIGQFCLVNSAASIDHTCRMSDYSSLAPGCTVGGDVVLGLRSALSIGSIVKNSITIGDDTVIGAASYVNKPIGDAVVAYGVPARVVRQRNVTDSYLN